VHRLVRKSPFDSNARRHTSFASVFVYPEVDESVEIDINPADLRVDVYRASGRAASTSTRPSRRCGSRTSLRHRGAEPERPLAAPQRAECMALLKSKLYDLEMRKRLDEHNKLEESKTDIGWGHQIRSYVLDQSRIKDLRTGVEKGATQSVLDGDLDEFITASLKQGV